MKHSLSIRKDAFNVGRKHLESYYDNKVQGTIPSAMSDGGEPKPNATSSELIVKMVLESECG